MTFKSGDGTPHQTPESLLTLAEYLELSLDLGGSLIMMRPRFQACAMYVKIPAGPKEDLRSCGMIEEVLADEILQLTHVGINHLEIDGQAYRFVRSFAHIARHGAVVFAPV
ncbi:hypothetical protein PPGU19_075700 (plasmid) [Paraburkholderia sp. PGU19]|uniref:hypothetical protein n=1 Tax=Paraburkholderia sp. PGU19 TaxID=2735434 RepID=UPI0015DC52E7|nr:hypothetical protein [Paraburkholderia sp. PGU19]BCG03002.1 hypothetical protein PPGU19_075700 [Paraburkholderia sp. PGU19]